MDKFHPEILRGPPSADVKQGSGGKTSHLICAKSGKDLFNISKVIDRKKVAQFFDSQCRWFWM